MANLENLPLGNTIRISRLCNRMNSILITINDCIEERRPFPALALIYSSIDVLGSLQSESGYATKTSFKNWVNDYLSRVYTFPCNDEDLYCARCGILHTMRYQSSSNSAKVLVYGFHGYDSDIKKISDHTKQAGIYIEDFFDAFVEAYLIYLEYLEKSTNSVTNSNLDKLPKYIDLISLKIDN